MPAGRGDIRDKKQKKKSKAQLEKDLLKRPTVAPLQPPTVEIVKPKRKVEEDW